MSTLPNSPPPLHQLPFPLHLQEKSTFENFYPSHNEVILRCLNQLIKQRDFTHSVYLWGHHFVGCTHLLKASYEAAQKRGIKAVYLSLAEAKEHHEAPHLTHLLKGFELVCLDDVEVIAHETAWEEALFTLYNHLVTQQIPMIFGAHQVPHQLSFHLKDVISRLNSGLLFKIHKLNDDEKIAALQLRAHLRGLELPEPVAQFMLSRLPRSPRVLVDALNQLDVFSLARQRKLTIPFVKDVLKL